MPYCMFSGFCQYVCTDIFFFWGEGDLFKKALHGAAHVYLPFTMFHDITVKMAAQNHILTEKLLPSVIPINRTCGTSSVLAWCPL